MPSVVLPAAPESPGDGTAVLRRSGQALLAVGLLFLLLQHVLVPGTMGFGTDEVIYLSQVDPEVPNQFWSEVRAWGVPVLAAPVAVFSPGNGVLRAWFSLLSSAGLVGAFWPWRRVLHPAVAPLAALLLATTWYTLFFASLVMPNLYVALGSVAAAGLFLRGVQDGRRRLAIGAGMATGFVALVRPSDSALLLAGVVTCALVVPRLRRLRVLAALVVGGLLGWLPWVVEAYVRFDGPWARLRGGNEAGLQGGLDLGLRTLQTYPRMLDGSPGYCCYGGPASEAGPLPLLHTGWFLAVPLLALVGLVVAHRQRRLPEVAVAVLPAGLFAGFYMLLLPFASVRFLLPVTALLSLPVAVGLVALVEGRLGRRRTLAALLAGAVVLGHLGLMLAEAGRELPAKAESRQVDVRVAQAARPLVTARPCVVIGDSKPQVKVRSYELGCRPQRVRPVTPLPPARVRAVLEQGGTAVALLQRRPPAGSYLRSWRPVPLPDADGTTAYLPP